ncbi:MAG: hypothetical protein ACR2PA_00605 [Hyphomicrobiaceae bacterium]
MMLAANWRLALIPLGAVVMLAASTAPFAAVAATITNADRVDRSITIIVGNRRTTHALKAGGLLEELCTDGCVVRIDDDPKRDFILEGRERVSIEDGLMYYDGEVAAKLPSDDKP